MTKAQARKLVAYLVAAFPQPPVPDSTVELYVQEIEALDFDDAKAACREMVLMSRFFPRVADLYEYCRDQARVRLREQQLADQERRQLELAVVKALYPGPPPPTDEEERAERKRRAAMWRESHERVGAAHALAGLPVKRTRHLFAPVEELSQTEIEARKRDALERLRAEYPDEFEPVKQAAERSKEKAK